MVEEAGQKWHVMGNISLFAPDCDDLALRRLMLKDKIIFTVGARLVK